MTAKGLWTETILDPFLAWLAALPVELAALMSDGRVAIAFIVGALVLLVAVGVGRAVGALAGVVSSKDPVSDRFALSLGIGITVIAMTWASFASWAQSASTIVAIAFGAIAIFGGIRLVRERALSGAALIRPPIAQLIRLSPGMIGLLAVAIAGTILLGLLLGTTIAPSPREMVQPMEFMDQAYYAVLAKHLDSTGLESIFAPSGFAQIPGTPTQTWYHWGEIWLASLLIRALGLDPMIARHLVVLPIVLVAVMALAGTVVRRATKCSAGLAWVAGGLGVLFLAPLPIRFDEYFYSWPRGMVFGITQYGLAPVSALLVIVLLLVPRDGARSPTLPAAFAGIVGASLIPAHLAIAAVAGAGAVVIVILRVLVAKRRAMQIRVDRGWKTFGATTVLVSVATLAWGVVTAHGLGALGQSEVVVPFSNTWRNSVLLAVVGSGSIALIPMAVILQRGRGGSNMYLYLWTLAVFAAGAVAWGFRLSDFNAFHFFFGGLVVLGGPFAAIATIDVVTRLRRIGMARLGMLLAVLFAGQCLVGFLTSVQRLREFGPSMYPPVPVAVIDALRGLPAGAKVAYSCDTLEEFAFWDARLIGLTAHSDRPMIPMCFQADYPSILLGAAPTVDRASPFFGLAPQRQLFPNAQSIPSPTSVVAFMRAHGIEYIYADAAHPNSLVPDAGPVYSRGDITIFRIS